MTHGEYPLKTLSYIPEGFSAIISDSRNFIISQRVAQSSKGGQWKYEDQVIITHYIQTCCAILLNNWLAYLL